MIMRLGILMISFLLLLGCTQNDDDHALPSEQKNPDNRIINVKNSAPKENVDYSNEQIANHLSHVASDVPEVNDAASIVVGPYAVVGIDVDEELDRSRVGVIKFSVLEALRHDPYGRTAVVVADGDITARIRGMNDKIRQGHPVQGVIDEVAAIVGRYMPDLPLPEDQPEEPDQNRKIINDENERQKMDEIIDDQSKNNREKRAD